MTALLEMPAAAANLPDAPCDDPLLQLMFRIARRADELARGLATDREMDRKFWDTAEREVLADPR